MPTDLKETLGVAAACSVFPVVAAVFAWIFVNWVAGCGDGGGCVLVSWIDVQ